MTVRALIFDVDGTLADTERDGHRVAFNRAFKEAGLDWEWGVEEYGELLRVTGGKERMKHYASLTPFPPLCESGEGERNLNDLIARLHAAKNRHYEALLAHNDIPLRPGIRSLLEEARAAGVRLAIATTTSPENVSALLSHALPGGEHWFEVIGAGDVVAAKKPAPDIYEWVLGELGLGAGECVAFEDSENGVRSAVGAGLKTIVSPNAYTRNHDFSGAVLVVEEWTGVDLEAVRRLV